MSRIARTIRERSAQPCEINLFENRRTEEIMGASSRPAIFGAKQLD